MSDFYLGSGHFYEASVKLTGVQMDKLRAIVKAVSKLDGFDPAQEFDWVDDDDSVHLLHATARLRGESEQGFATRIAKAAWDANPGFCNVEVWVANLTAIPTEEFEFGEENYQQYRQMLEAK